MSGYNNIPHKAAITSNKQKTENPRKIIAYRGLATGIVYFPSLFGGKEVTIGVEGDKLRVFSSWGFDNRAIYEPIYEGDEEFTITIK